MNKLLAALALTGAALFGAGVAHADIDDPMHDEPTPCDKSQVDMVSHGLRCMWWHDDETGDGYFWLHNGRWP